MIFNRQYHRKPRNKTPDSDITVLSERRPAQLTTILSSLLSHCQQPGNKLPSGGWTLHMNSQIPVQSESLWQLLQEILLPPPTPSHEHTGASVWSSVWATDQETHNKTPQQCNAFLFRHYSIPLHFMVFIHCKCTHQLFWNPHSMYLLTSLCSSSKGFMIAARSICFCLNCSYSEPDQISEDDQTGEQQKYLAVLSRTLSLAPGIFS